MLFTVYSLLKRFRCCRLSCPPKLWCVLHHMSHRVSPCACSMGTAGCRLQAAAQQLPVSSLCSRKWVQTSAMHGVVPVSCVSDVKGAIAACANSHGLLTQDLKRTSDQLGLCKSAGVCSLDLSLSLVAAEQLR